MVEIARGQEFEVWEGETTKRWYHEMVLLDHHIISLLHNSWPLTLLAFIFTYICKKWQVFEKVWWSSMAISWFLHFTPRPTTLDLSTYNYQPFTALPLAMLYLHLLLSRGLIILLHNPHSHALSPSICMKLQVIELPLLIQFETERARGQEFEAKRARVWGRAGEGLR